MKTENKYRWMVWAIIVLAVMNISTVLTFVYNRNQVVKSVPVNDGIQSENASMRYSGRFFRDNLNLNNEQMGKFVEFNPVFRQSVRSINSDLVDSRNQMLIELTKNNCDTSKLNILSDSIGNLHADLKKLTYKYYLDLKEICDEQQQVKLLQMFGDIFAADGRMGQFGKGGPQGRGRGRRFNN